LLAFGQNTKGQLGIGTIADTFMPTRLAGDLRDKGILMACGGDHHSLFLTTEGEVYTVGSNDEG